MTVAPRFREREAAIKYTAQKRKRRRRKNYLLYYIMFAIITVIVCIVLSSTVFFNIDKIEVEGIAEEKVEEIISLSQVSIGSNLFRLNVKDVESKILKADLTLDDINVVRKLPSTLLIQAQVGKVKICAENEGFYTYISEAGRVLETNMSEPYKGVHILKGFDPAELKKGDFIIQKDPVVMLFLEIEGYLEAHDFDKVSYIDLTKPDDIKFLYDERITVKIGLNSEIKYKIEGAKAIIDEYVKTQLTDTAEGEIEYIKSKEEFRYIPKQEEQEYNLGRAE